jgi:hypothetical protein
MPSAHIRHRADTHRQQQRFQLLHRGHVPDAPVETEGRDDAQPDGHGEKEVIQRGRSPGLEQPAQCWRTGPDIFIGGYAPRLERDV